jgi:hypothetical protein
MPDSPHNREEMSANTAKASQQSQANWSRGIKTRHMGFFSGHKMGREATNAALWSTGDPVSWDVKTPTNAQLPEAGRAGYSREAGMFLWTSRQSVFLLVMLVVCTMGLTHPVWQHWYKMVFPPLCIIMAILALDYVLRK